MTVQVTIVPWKNSVDDERKTKSGLKSALNGGLLGQSSVRIISIVWEDNPGRWVVTYES